MEERELYKDLYAELEKYENRGVSIRLNNQPASPMQIVTAHMVKEENAYMRDYVWDDKEMSKNLDFTVLATVKKCTDTPLALTIKMLIIAEIVEIVDDVYKNIVIIGSSRRCNMDERTKIVQAQCGRWQIKTLPQEPEPRRMVQIEREETVHQGEEENEIWL